MTCSCGCTFTPPEDDENTVIFCPSCGAMRDTGWVVWTDWETEGGGAYLED